MSYLKSISRKKKLYGNYKVLSPDNIPMFRCNEKKISWYLKRDLADIIDSKTIRLKFKPNGLGNYNKNYGLFEMENKCVRCGSEEHLTKHHVVPSCYRTYFPNNLKSHSFHDVVSLCTNCHSEYETHAFLLKKKLSDIYQAPINGIISKDIEMLRAKKLTRSLTSDVHIPKSRIFEMKSEIKDLIGVKRLSKSKIRFLLSSKFTISCEKTHGEIVISKIENLNEFIKMWRSHFIETMNCKFLPQNWSINNDC